MAKTFSKPSQKSLLIFFAVLVAAVVFIIATQKKSLEITAEPAESDITPSVPYSFSQDNDRDGLSNAKEIIYSTDPENPDTDGDGYLDGAEVAKGYDPAKPGKARLQERKNLSLTIRYFIWFRKHHDKEPVLDKDSIEKFLKSQNLLDFSFPPVEKSRFNLAPPSKTAIRTYLEATAKISLPNNVSSYSQIALEILEGKKSPELVEIIRQLKEAELAFENVPTPPQAIPLEKEYIGSVKILEGLFKDLERAKEDPVQISLNQRKGLWLTQKLNDIDQKRLKLANLL